MPVAFNNHIHNFRALAIIGVVCAHSLHNFTWPAGSLTFQSLDTIFNQSTIWFAFISGFLFQYLLPKYQTTKYYRAKAKNVITPYLLWSIPALVVALFIIPQDVPSSFYEGSLFEQAFLFLVTGRHLAPFWYIPTITLIFLMAPLLRLIDAYRLPYLILPLLIVLSAYLGRDGLLVVFDLPASFSSLAKAVYLLAPYMMGMLASRYHDKIMDLMARLHWVLLALAGTFFYLEIEHYHQQHLYIYLFKMLTCFSLLYYLRQLDWLLGTRFKIVADLSFGLFFIHGFVLAALKLAHGWLYPGAALPGGTLLSYGLFCAVVILACLAMLKVAKFLLGTNSRWTIGC